MLWKDDSRGWVVGRVDDRQVSLEAGRKVTGCLCERWWLLDCGNGATDHEKGNFLGSSVNQTFQRIGYQEKSEIKNESQIFDLNNWVSSGGIYK